MSDSQSPAPVELFNAETLVDFSTKVYGDWRDEFHQYGCVVIKGVISRDRAEYYRGKQIEWLKKFDLGFDEKDKSTWANEHLPCNFKGGMYFLYGATHENFVWEARLEPGVIDVFTKLWETEELLVAFDGFNISFPNRQDAKWSPWPHCDQSPNRKGMQVVQGLLNFAPNGPNDGGLVLMKGAAKLFDEFFATRRKMADHEDAPPAELEWEDLFLFNEDHVQWFKDRGCELIKINLDPGDMVLWDSRTMHYARLPEGDQIRHAQYICMTPKRFATPEVLELRKKCFDEYLGTTHWPHRNIHITTMKPMRGDQVCPKNRDEPFEKPVINDLMLKMVGVKEY